MRIAQLSRIRDAAVAAPFLAFLLLPTLDMLLGLDPLAREEAPREPFVAPEGGFGSFARAFDSYFDGGFGFRTSLIRLHALKSVYLLRTPSSSKVLLGRDGWLFYSVGAAFDRSAPAAMTASELERWGHIFESRRRWLAEHGIEYAVLVAPDKESIYPEYLPTWAQRRHHVRLDQLVEELRRRAVRLVDPRTSLTSAKPWGRLYWKTDTHWTDLGAHVAYTDLVRALGAFCPDVGAPVPADRFETVESGEKNGDLVDALGLRGRIQERSIALRELRGVSSGSERKIVQAPEGAITIIRNPAVADLRILVHADSFSFAMVPFLFHNASEATYLWKRSFDKATILRVRPLIVIDEFVERVLWGDELKDLFVPLTAE